jgi:hypothetical protein
MSNSLRKDLPGFLETPRFTQSWQHFGLTDADLHALQVTIMERPTRFPVVSGTAGLRKVRFAPESKPVGKRGGLRVCYVHFARFGVILLVLVYAKTSQQDIAPAEKKSIRLLIQAYESWFEQRFKQEETGE